MRVRYNDRFVASSPRCNRFRGNGGLNPTDRTRVYPALRLSRVLADVAKTWRRLRPTLDRSRPALAEASPFGGREPRTYRRLGQTLMPRCVPRLSGAAPSAIP